MSKRKERAKKRQAIQKMSKLEPPFGSSPGASAKYVFYVSHGSKRGVYSFRSKYAARHFIEFMTENDEYTQNKETSLRTLTGLKIRCKLLDEVLNYRLTETEYQWSLRSSLPSWVYSSLTIIKNNVQLDELMAKKREFVSSPHAEDRNILSIGDIAESMGISPREARARLRAADITKPGKKWEWSVSDASKIRITITKTY